MLKNVYVFNKKMQVIVQKNGSYRPKKKTQVIEQKCKPLIKEMQVIDQKIES